MLPFVARTWRGRPVHRSMYLRFISVARACRDPLASSCMNLQICGDMRIRVNLCINAHIQAIKHVSVYWVDEITYKKVVRKSFFIAKARKSFLPRVN